MNIFKNIDAYLLRHYPSIWITRAHYFLPIGLGIILLIFGANVLTGWNPKGPMPDGETFTYFMVIPVIVYLVYWFIFQARYNVVKSGGKVNVGQEYLNLFLYAAVFTVAYFFILVIPFSNDYKMKFAIGYDQFQEDLSKLNAGNGIMNSYEALEDLGNGKYSFYESTYMDDYYRYDYYGSYDYSVEPESNKLVSLTKREVLMRIEDFVEVYNKYTKTEILLSPQEVLDNRLLGYEVINDFGYYGNGGWEEGVNEKMSKLNKLYKSKRYLWTDKWFWMVSAAVIFWLALTVWIFKQMARKYFVWGLISICLTPIFVGIMGAIIFSIGNNYDNGTTQFALMLVILSYVAIAILISASYFKNTLNQTAYVATMFWQFWLPLLPLFIYGLAIINRNYWNYNGNHEIMGLREEDFVYWASFGLSLASILVFKPIYSKFRALPLNK